MDSIYYQHNPQRVSTCPVTIHALLHIAPSIRATGPVWTSWAFPIERFCGSLLPGVKSRRFPYVSLDRHVTEAAQLLQIKLTRNLSEVLQLQPARRPVRGQFLDASCMSKSLLFSLQLFTNTRILHRPHYCATPSTFYGSTPFTTFQEC